MKEELMKQVWLDHAATTPVHPDVLGTMLPYFGYHFAAPAGHTPGRDAREAVETARSRTAALLGVKPAEIIFTASATEAINLALAGIIPALDTHSPLVTTSMEHPAVLEVLRALSGDNLTILPVDQDGALAPALLHDALTPQTPLIACQFANHITGVLQPVNEATRLAGRHGALFFCDAVAAAGHVPLNARHIKADLMPLTAHKFYGPKGAGALFVRQGVHLAPRLYGNGQERALRPGTENVPAIVGLGMACDIARGELDDHANQVRQLRDRFESLLLQKIPDACIPGRDRERLPHLSCVIIPDTDGRDLQAALDVRGIAAAAAPPNRNGTVTHTLGGHPLRLSFGRTNTPADPEHVAQILARAALRLQTLEPSWDCLLFSAPDFLRRAEKVLAETGHPFAVVCTPPPLQRPGCHPACIRTPEGKALRRTLATHGIITLGVRQLVHSRPGT